MLDYLLHLYGDTALYLYALLNQYLFPELALVVAAAWPALICLVLLGGVLLYFTWQDRRTLNRHLNRRLEQVRQQLGE
jgi:uncharacterized protein (DUF58 family)